MAADGSAVDCFDKGVVPRMRWRWPRVWLVTTRSLVTSAASTEARVVDGERWKSQGVRRAQFEDARVAPTTKKIKSDRQGTLKVEGRRRRPKRG